MVFFVIARFNLCVDFIENVLPVFYPKTGLSRHIPVLLSSVNNRTDDNNNNNNNNISLLLNLYHPK